MRMARYDWVGKLLKGREDRKDMGLHMRTEVLLRTSSIGPRNLDAEQESYIIAARRKILYTGLELPIHMADASEASKKSRVRKKESMSCQYCQKRLSPLLCASEGDLIDIDNSTKCWSAIWDAVIG